MVRGFEIASQMPKGALSIVDWKGVQGKVILPLIGSPIAGFLIGYLIMRLIAFLFVCLNIQSASAQSDITWLGLDFSADNEDDFLKAAGICLRPADDIARLDGLLWDGDEDQARRMLDRVDDAHRACPPIHQQAEGHGLVLKEDFLDCLLLRAPDFGRHCSHPLPSHAVA